MFGKRKVYIFIVIFIISIVLGLLSNYILKDKGTVKDLDELEIEREDVYEDIIEGLD